MTTSREDADALFDMTRPLPAPPAPKAQQPSQPHRPEEPSTGRSGALGGFGLPSAEAEGRREQRVKVSWAARVQLPNGRVVDLRARDLSDGGVGLVSDHHIPSYAVLNFAMAVPDLNDPCKITPISGTIKTAYMVVQGPVIYCGGSWVNLPADARDLLGKWIRKLKR
jgi:hypothetical protein